MELKIKQIELRNFRIHHHLILDFADGITAICGPNGTGKSAIVEAILVLLNGTGYDPKEKIITLGEAAGYVRGTLEIDGKEAVLKRHLDSSTTHLTYEGKTLKKAGEVAELWDRLFQIDKSLVKNVIVSTQGEITLLFNGPEAAKEALFQKIFMVPATTKIREQIWEYIKTTPPVYNTEDTDSLTTQMQQTELLHKMTQDELNSLKLKPPGAFDELNKKMYDLGQRRDAIATRVLLNSEYNILATEITQLRAQETEAQSIRQALPTTQRVEEGLAAVRHAKTVQERRTILETRIAELVAPTPFDQQGKTALETWESILKTREDEYNGGKFALDTADAKLRELKSSKLSSGVCPTCGTAVSSTLQLITHMEQERGTLNEKLQLLIPGVQEARSAVQSWRTLQTAYQQHIDQKQRLEGQLLAIDATGKFDPEQLELLEKAKAGIADVERQISELAYHLTGKTRRLGEIQAKLDVLPGTAEDNQVTLEHEIQGLKFEVEEYVTKREAYQRLTSELDRHKRQLDYELQRIATNKGQIESNATRESYLQLLQSTYDVLHTSKFPRALIQTYAAMVNDYINQVLESFDFPYQAKVNDSFGIDVFNEEGQLPRVSGGQQVMVGFALRLALHNMFVGGFPFMVIDEGSYGLAGDACTKYFEIIASLKRSKFKQVIVIDHNAELANYVDQTINLTRP